MSAWTIIKFGGTSVSGVTQWNQIISTIEKHHKSGQKVILVHSAFSGLTNALEQINSGEISCLDFVIKRAEEMASRLEVDFSLFTQEVSQLTAAVSNIKKSLENPINKNDNTQFLELKNIFEKSLAVNKDLKKGHILRFSDLETKKPKGYGILANDYEKVIGKKINKDLSQWDFLNDKDLKI